MIRRLLRWLVRFLITILVLFLITVVVDVYSHKVQRGSFLLVKIDGPVLERGSAGFFTKLTGRAETPLNLLRKALSNAEKDPRIAGVAVEIINPDLAFAKAQEVVSMMREVRKSGKPVLAYLETAGEFSPGNLEYLVASAADNISLMPQGEINLVGLQIRELFLRGTLDWLGINPQFEAIGQYKSAPNLFTEKGFTPAQREEDTALVDSLFNQLVATIAENRHLDPATVRSLIDQAPLDAKTALSVKLVDRLEYEDQFRDRVRHYQGSKHKLISYVDYAKPYILPRLSTAERIAVVYGSGEIDRDSGIDPFAAGSSTLDPRTMRETFREIRKDDSIKAVIFRINSPGGSVIASELIRREVEITARIKPVIVTMSSFGASGAYWVATAATRIVAEPATITGSIGVLAGKFNFSQAAAKVGINSEAISRGKNITMFDEFTDFTAEQQQLLHSVLLQRIYDEFVSKVAQSRKLPLEQVEQVAQGRAWTGEQAFKLKLVDALGGFDEALKLAKTAAKIPAESEVELVELPAQPGLISQLLGTAEVRALVRHWLRAKATQHGPALRMELISTGVRRMLYSQGLTMEDEIPFPEERLFLIFH